ncbi:MAG: PHP domain-containing protein, partial [Clostridia bacterium]|nr:PHP domain-containing protein [Clostridia bacterium]
MILADFHTHTNYCDGKHTPEEMVLGAIERGLEAIGFTEHSYTPFDLRYCLTEEKTEQYIRDVRSLQQKYGNRIKIYCGL